MTTWTRNEFGDWTTKDGRHEVRRESTERCGVRYGWLRIDRTENGMETRTPFKTASSAKAAR